MAVFHYLQLRAFAHETEDPERVRAAVRHAAQSPDLALRETHVEGSHKNRILILEADLKKAPTMRTLFTRFGQDDPEGFRQLVQDVDRRLDEEQNFYLRFDKQAAYEGQLVLTTGDDAITLRGKIRSFQSKRSGNQQQEARAALEAFLGDVASRVDSSVGQ